MAAQKSWNIVEAALVTMKPLPWKKTMRGSFLGFGLEEDSAIQARNKRSQILFCWLMVRSMVRTKIGRVGS